MTLVADPRRVVLALAKACLAVVAAACAAPGGGGAEPDPQRMSVESKGRELTVTWHSIPQPIPVNGPFELVVDLADSDGAAIDDARLFVRGYMPDHGHGMLRLPVATNEGGGRYTVRGMLFHMSGHWVLSFDVIRAGIAAVAELDVEL